MALSHFGHRDSQARLCSPLHLPCPAALAALRKSCVCDPCVPPGTATRQSWHGCEPGLPSPARALRLQPPTLQPWAWAPRLTQGGLMGLLSPRHPGPLVCRHHGSVSWLREHAAGLGRPPRQLCAGAKAGGRQGWRSSGEHPRAALLPAGREKAERSFCLLRAQELAGLPAGVLPQGQHAPLRPQAASEGPPIQRQKPFQSPLLAIRQKGCLIPT